MKVLVIGATGMLGYSIFSHLSDDKNYHVVGSVRNIQGKERYFVGRTQQLIYDVDVNQFDSISGAIKQVNPQVVINCIGLIKQYDAAKSHVEAIDINALFPHKLAVACNEVGAKLIHFSTDCVFSGEQGAYSEADSPDAQDLYGKSKCLGEVDYAPHLTLRTSIIGHELTGAVSLIDWFLSQTGKVNGFSRAIFSGLPTCYVAQLLSEHILPKQDLSGLYHLSVDPIDKFTLLNIVSDIYSRSTTIHEQADFVINRSLDSSKLSQALNIHHPQWVELIQSMYLDYCLRYKPCKS